MSLATNITTIRININIRTFVNIQAKEMINMQCSFLGYEITSLYIATNVFKKPTTSIFRVVLKNG